MHLDQVRATRPPWRRTGFLYYPYAAQLAGAWWVLRMNHGFPEHDMYTLFIDGAPVADITAGSGSSPFEASVARLDPSPAGVPPLKAAAARAAVATVARFADYGSEHGDPCDYCFRDKDGFTPA